LDILYCDICGSPVKDKDYYKLYITKYTDGSEIKTEDEYYKYLDFIQKQLKDVCPSCKVLLDEIFKLKFNNVSAINAELLGIFNLPVKDHENKKKE
jgi:hypothetical protein